MTLTFSNTELEYLVMGLVDRSSLNTLASLSVFVIQILILCEPHRVYKNAASHLLTITQYKSVYEVLRGTHSNPPEIIPF